jgi:hypothetical protein
VLRPFWKREGVAAVAVRHKQAAVLDGRGWAENQSWAKVQEMKSFRILFGIWIFGKLWKFLQGDLEDILSRWLLLRPLRLEARTLGLKVRPLRQILRARHLYWHWRLVHLEWLEKLVRRREARPNITPSGLSREWHFPLAILFHFPDLVLNDNGLVDHVLEVGVVGVEQLELNIINQSTQEHVLLLLVDVDVVRGIP